MLDYPVRYEVVPPVRFSRMQLLVRLAAFVALGILGISFGSVFCALFFFLPVLAAVRSPDGAYVERDGARVLAGLRWFAAVTAWAGLIVERLPTSRPDEVVRLDVRGTGHPTPGSALVRILSGLPSLFVLGILTFVGGFVWLWAALSILFAERIGAGAFGYLTGLQRWSLRLLAYQASLVDEYPPFSLGASSDEGAPRSQSGAAAAGAAPR